MDPSSSRMRNERDSSVSISAICLRMGLTFDWTCFARSSANPPIFSLAAVYWLARVLRSPALAKEEANRTPADITWKLRMMYWTDASTFRRLAQALAAASVMANLSFHPQHPCPSQAHTFNLRRDRNLVARKEPQALAWDISPAGI